MNLIIKRSIFVLVFLLPFVFLTSSLFPFSFPKVLFIEIFAIILGTLYLVNRLYRKDNNIIISNSLVFWVFFVYLLSFLISCLTSVAPVLSFWGSLERGISIPFLLSLFALSLIISFLFKSLEDWLKLFAVFISSGILFTVGSFIAGKGINLSSNYKIMANTGFTFGNSSFAGFYLAFIFFISLGVFLSSKIKFHKVLGVLGMLSAFLNPVITGFIFSGGKLEGQARTALYSILIGIIIFVLYFIFRKISSVLWKKIFIGFLSLIFIFGLFIIVNKSSSVKQIIIEKAGGDRLVFWDIAMKGFKEKPVLGWGNNTYHLVYAKYFDPIIMTPGYDKELWIDKSHSIYFDELVSGGIIGFVLLMFLYGVLLFGLIRSAIREKSKDNFLFVSLFIALITILIQGIMLFQTATAWFLVVILMSFVSNFCFKNKDIFKKEIDLSKYKIVIGTSLVVLCCIGMVYVVFKPYNISHKLTSLSSMGQSDRLLAYKQIDKSYIGNTEDVGGVFLPIFANFRNAFKNEKTIPDGVKKQIMDEMTSINILLDNSLKRENYKDVKILTSIIGFDSIFVAITTGSEQEEYYKEGIVYVDKMAQASPNNPIIEMSKGMLDFSLKYGLSSLQI